MEDFSLFNKICILESIPNGQLKSGLRLYEDRIQQAEKEHENLHASYSDIQNKKEFYSALKLIEKEATESGLYPMLHIDCHGSKSGLQLKNGEEITWAELRDYLIDINKACRLNLVITLAACNGTHLIYVVNKLDRAPFRALIAPVHEISAGEIEADFKAFYETFFRTLSGDEAMKALNRGIISNDLKYNFFSIKGLFLKAYAKYLANHCIGKGRQKRIEELLSKSRKNPDVRRHNIGDIRKRIKDELKKIEEPRFYEVKKRFFFEDLYPENEKQFLITYEQVKDAATHLL
jgi:hypothetical protein